MKYNITFRHINETVHSFANNMSESFLDKIMNSPNYVIISVDEFQGGVA